MPQEISPKAPPSKSRGVLSDVRSFMWKRPPIPTVVNYKSAEERLNFSQRIMQRLAISVSDYSILNIHRIGIEAPVRYVFEELLKWGGDSTCWPNHIAHVVRTNERLEEIRLYLLGWENGPFGLRVPPLFNLSAIRFHRAPEALDCDNARYLLYACSGGYPIGIFSMYVRSPIREQGEVEPSQLFLVVGFNFYGKEALSHRRIINRPWEWVHNRVTTNVMNRFKQLCEWRFQTIQEDWDR